MKKITLIVIMLSFSTVANSFAEKLETDPSLSRYDISLFTQAAECLSIKASKEEKISFISATHLDVKVNNSLKGKTFDKNLIEKQIRLYEKDFENIVDSLKKHCPMTLNKVKYRIDNFKNDNDIFLDSLQEYIVTVIFAEIAEKKDRAKRFESNYSE